MNKPIFYRYRLQLAYDGSQTCGWQVQNNSPSIQSLLAKALSIATRENVYPIASGRTDAGVHARAQIVHFDLTRLLSCKQKLLHSLAGLLPKSIRATYIEPCSIKFHARYSAKAKIYRYYIHTDLIESPFEYAHRWHVRHLLDLHLLDQASTLLEGTHNFKAFANENNKGAAGFNSIRTLYHVKRIPVQGGFYLEFKGDGFLYKMVRNCVGLLIEIARGHQKKERINDLFKSGQRSHGAACAPSHGLFLHQVIYPLTEGPSDFLILE